MHEFWYDYVEPSSSLELNCLEVPQIEKETIWKKITLVYIVFKKS